MPEPGSAIYTFNGLRVDAAERSLFGVNGLPVQLSPKVFDTLLMLVTNAGRVLSKERMLAEIWDDSFVEENNLAQNISQLRRVLGESAESRFIETVPKYGYRFVADVSVADTATPKAEIVETTWARIDIDDSTAQPLVTTPSPLTPLPSVIPETHYVANGDVSIAYQVVGDGPIDIVFVMGWVSHLEYFWKHHLFASFLEKLSTFSRLILFDKRGTGLSDRVPLSELPTLEQRMEDVHAVMDAVNSDRAILVGVSEGGPMCSLFAATYPERTAGLVMIGTYAKRIRDDDYPWAPTEEQREAFFELMLTDWGKPVGIEERAPSMATDEEFRDWWATYLRMGASPGAAVALTRMNAEIDVRGVLPSIRVPTLVIHRAGDLCLKVEEGRFVASQIPGAKYVELGGIDHLPFVGDQDEIVAAIEEFAAGVQYGADHDRVLATVLCVLVEDFERLSTTAANHFVTRQLQIFKGREVTVEKGRLLAAFDGPARAIRCARSISQSAGRRGLRIQSGLHTGECDVVNGTYGGLAVDLAERIAGLSTGGDILVSRTVKDLVAGSGLTFTECGRHVLQGIDGEWRLFCVDGR